MALSPKAQAMLDKLTPEQRHKAIICAARRMGLLVLRKKKPRLKLIKNSNP